MNTKLAYTNPIYNSLAIMQDMKAALFRLQRSPGDIAVARTIPCATQSIRELSSYHGYKHIVAFSSVLEGVLIKVRATEFRADENLIMLLLSCCDHLSSMLNQLDGNDEMYLGHFKKSLGLIRQLRTYNGSNVREFFGPGGLSGQY